jgi:hypothetical protein
MGRKSPYPPSPPLKPPLKLRDVLEGVVPISLQVITLYQVLNPLLDLLGVGGKEGELWGGGERGGGVWCVKR